MLLPTELTGQSLKILIQLQIFKATSVSGQLLSLTATTILLAVQEKKTHSPYVVGKTPEKVHVILGKILNCGNFVSSNFNTFCRTLR